MNGQIERMRDRANSVPAVVALQQNNVLIEKVFDRFQPVLGNRSRATLLLLWFIVISLRRDW